MICTTRRAKSHEIDRVIIPDAGAAKYHSD